MSENVTNQEVKMVWFPSVKLGVDTFEELLSEALCEASPADMRAGATKAARYIENVTQDAGLDMNRINNATSTLCRIISSLSGQVESLRAELEKGEEK